LTGVRRRQRQREQRNARPSPGAPASGAPGNRQRLERDLNALIGELEDLSRKISAEIDTYFAKLEAVIASRMQARMTDVVTICGKFCESGDILVRDEDIPGVVPGDIIAIPVSGAYCLAMASNYNASLKPAIVMVKNGKARLIRRRESYEDLMRFDSV
jgi:hypothetical protein